MAGEAEVIDNEDKEFQDAFNEAANKKDGSTAEIVQNDDVAAAAAAENLDPGENNDPEPDPYDGMSEDAKARYIDMEHKFKSESGRTGALQRKINNLEHDIAVIPKKPSTEDISNAMGTDEKWDEFTEEYPDVAAAINGRLDTFDKSVTSKIDTSLEPVLTKQAEEDQKDSYGEVAETFPTWQDAVKTPEFNDWMAEQSPGIKALAGSDDTQDASTLIGMYDDSRVATGHDTLRADPSPDGNSVDDTANDLAAKRARQLQDGAAIESKSARIDPNAESGTEFENAFNAFAARKEANRA